MTATIQRPLRGSRITTFYPIKTLPSLSSLDSAFQLQEYISLLIRLDIHDVEAITSLPGKDKDGQAPLEESEGQKLQGEEKEGEKKNEVDEACWVYEQLRRLAQDLTQPLITTLQQECTRASCPEMKAGEWLYLCVAHGNEGSMEQCCAIDYILHTLDSATALLNSPRAFPSRLQIPSTSHRHFSSLARRLGRIFAHAYFHHREAFEQAEAESSLYARFLALSSKFELVPPEFLPIPPEAFAAHGDGYDHDIPRDIPPPRLDAAAPTAAAPSPQAPTDRGPPSFPSFSQNPFPVPPSSSSQHLSLAVPETKGHSPPGLGAEGSPRRVGRNRTGTMVPSDASVIIEELAARAAEAPDLSLSPTDEFPPSLGTARPPPEVPVQGVDGEEVDVEGEEGAPHKSDAEVVVPTPTQDEVKAPEAEEVPVEEEVVPAEVEAPASDEHEAAAKEAPESATSIPSDPSESVESAPETPVTPEETVSALEAEAPPAPVAEKEPEAEPASSSSTEGPISEAAAAVEVEVETEVQVQAEADSDDYLEVTKTEEAEPLKTELKKDEEEKEEEKVGTTDEEAANTANAQVPPPTAPTPAATAALAESQIPDIKDVTDV